MTNKKLLMFAVAGAIAPAASAGLVQADTGSSITVMVPEPKVDLAPIRNGKLRRTDQEQPGNEMPAFAFFTDASGKGTKGLYFSMTTELNGTAAKNKIQLSATPFELMQATDGTVYAQANATAAKFVTANNGNERRNANAPKAFTINGGSAVLVQYNYQPNGTNDTVTYFQVFNAQGVSLLTGGQNGQVKAYAKNNDDCSMVQDGQGAATITTGTGVTKIVGYAGCNGNGRDDGWVFVSQVKCDSATAPTSCQFQNLFDLSVEPQEERSRGNCTVDAADTSYAVCSWTAGNNQPQRNGVWLGAVDLSTNATGSNQQQTLLWKQQIAGRVDNNPAANNQRTYAQRAISERIMTTSSTGALVPSNQLLYTYGDAVGRNNNKGTYFTRMVSVMQVSRTGMTYVVQPTNFGSVTQLGPVGGTHLGSTAAMFAGGTPGILFMSGSLNGGGGGGKAQGLAVDPTTKQFKLLGVTGSAPQDMHLYPNYLGNNPGNQGRNHSQMTLVPNPFAGQSAYLLMTASTAKTLESTATHGTLKTANTQINPAIKLTALMTITPMGGMALSAVSGTSANTGVDNPDDTSNASSDPGTTLGGCQASGGSSSLATLLLVGLAAFARRRRR